LKQETEINAKQKAKAILAKATETVQASVIKKYSKSILDSIKMFLASFFASSQTAAGVAAGISV